MLAFTALESLFEFSRGHCIAICAVLVPMNLLATLQTLLFAGFRQSRVRVQWMAAVASLYALLLVLHVITWYVIGVVMAPTYILTVLGSVCLIVNSAAVIYACRGSQEPSPQVVHQGANKKPHNWVAGQGQLNA